MKILRKGNGRKVVADEEFDVEETAPVEEEAGVVDVADEATELLFETEDVAQLIAEVTGEDVEVSTDDETEEVEFAVGDEVFTITPDEDIEDVESSRKIKRSLKRVSASRQRSSRAVKASTKRAARPAKKSVRRISK